MAWIRVRNPGLFDKKEGENVRLTTRAKDDGFHLDIRLDWGQEYDNVVLEGKVITEFAGVIDHEGNTPPPVVDPAGFLARIGESLLNVSGAIKTS